MEDSSHISYHYKSTNNTVNSPTDVTETQEANTNTFKYYGKEQQFTKESF